MLKRWNFLKTGFYEGIKIRFTATGFLFGHPAAKSNKRQRTYWVFLVTNRHVVANRDKLMIRFNAPMSTPSKVYPLPMGDSDMAAHWVFIQIPRLIPS